jgi:hypothetical protein
MANFLLTDVFSFHNPFWFPGAYLVGLAQRIPQLIVTNLRHSKLLLKILFTHNIKNVISLKVRILMIITTGLRNGRLLSSLFSNEFLKYLNLIIMNTYMINNKKCIENMCFQFFLHFWFSRKYIFKKFIF